MNPDSAIVLFGDASHMKWNHLPVQGGIYDQDPELLRKWRYIWDKIAAAERAERQKQKQKDARESSRSRGRRR